MIAENVEQAEAKKPDPRDYTADFDGVEAEIKDIIHRISVAIPRAERVGNHYHLAILGRMLAAVRP